MASQRNNHLHPNINVYILHTFHSLYFTVVKRGVFFFFLENQEFLNLVIIFIIVMTFKIDSKRN